MRRTRTLFVTAALAAIAVLITAAAGQVFPFGGPHEPHDPTTVAWINPGLNFPAVGNIGDVEEWTFGRIQGAEVATGNPDALVRIRTPDGRTWEITAPRGPLVELARVSNWLEPDKQYPGSSDYVERMVAFDADETGRLIAMVSLEPQYRHRRNLRRALGR